MKDLKVADCVAFARRTPADMHYRLWMVRRRDRSMNGIQAATARRSPRMSCWCRASALPRPVGYGGGYFDRWLAAHPQVCAVGLLVGGSGRRIGIRAAGA
jgi:hypothetical protein